MLKRRELSDPTSCINRAAPNEPVFVLRGQDRFAPIVVRIWATLVENCAGDTDKVCEARALAALMDAWPTKKVPD